MARISRSHAARAAVLASALAAACAQPAGTEQSAGRPAAFPVTPATCPAPTNDVPLDMELGLPLGYLAYPSLGIFNVYWGEGWDSIPGNFARADIERALRNVIATPYFDRLCQYGVPGFHFEGSAGTDGLVGCARNPGATTSTPDIFGFMSCEEFTPFTGVPLAVGLPNPACVACGLAPVDCVNPVTLLAEPLCLATPNPTSNRVYVVLLPKGTTIDDFGTRSCPPGGGYNAYHFQIPSRGVISLLPPFIIPGTQGRPINLAVIPTECFDSLEDLITAITHEVVEAATDPLPLAHWLDLSSTTPGGVFDITRIGSLFTDGEANDICLKLGFGQTLFTAPDGQLVGVAPYWSNADNACVSLDVTPPVSSAALSPAANASGWNDTDVTVAIAATDSGMPSSGVKEIVFSATGAQPIAPTTVPGAAAAVAFTVEGVSVLAFHAVDNAGNVEADHARTVRIDKTPPVSSAALSPAPNASGWNNTGVTVAITAADSGMTSSGVKEIVLSATGAQPIAPTSVPADAVSVFFAAEGVSTLSFHAVDKAGNVEADHVIAVRIDRTPPVSSAALSPAPNANGWNNADVTVAIAATDAGAPASGVKEIVFSAAGAQPIVPTAVPGDAAAATFTVEGVSVLAFHAVDNAGNVEAGQTRTIRVDKTPPVVVWSGNAGTYTVDQDVAITCSASDALSGLASTTCAGVAGPAWSFGLGSHTLTASATDRAGNVGSASTTFTVEVTFASLCNLTGSFSSGNPAIAEALCRWLDRAAGALCCEEVEVAVQMYRQKIWPHVPRFFTPAQARTLSDLGDALRPVGCDLRADACRRVGRGP